MGDFFQQGAISTLHRLGNRDLESLEAEIKEHGDHRPLALILPAVYAEFERKALPSILKQLKEVNYLNEIVMVMNKTNAMEFKRAKKILSNLDLDINIVWSSGPRIGELYKLLDENELSLGEDGKGRSVWIAFGYVIANEKSEVIVLHDCDIVNYSRELLARLCYPLANPNLGYEFCKGYYSRVTDRMFGRVTRLYFTPLVRALQKIVGYHPFLVYLDSFRYPLAGEFSQDVDLARAIRIPSDWGLEVGVLAEVYRNCVPKRICQVDLVDTYEHKHQELSPDDRTKGLLKMCIDITKSLFRTLSQEGIIISAGLLRTLTGTYLRAAQDTIKRYEDDAFINNLFFDRHAEVTAVETFLQGIKIAGKEFLDDPLGIPEIPNWNRVTSAIPDFLERLKETVAEDNK
ncbi:MAG: glycosyl transferase [candidate division Zixibacteria bacterium SM23_73_2]|nr:MAG: glycosyl transferase [candidate division Zixibacteria bacterium SM23_73_2]